MWLIFDLVPNVRQSGPNQVYGVFSSPALVTFLSLEPWQKKNVGPYWGCARGYLLLLIIQYSLIDTSLAALG